MSRHFSESDHDGLGIDVRRCDEKGRAHPIENMSNEGD